MRDTMGRMRRKILVLNERDPANPLAGGAEVHIFEIFRRLVDRGHEVRLLAAAFGNAPRRERIQGVDVHRLVNRYGFYGVAPLAARRHAVRDDFDIVVDVLNKLPFFSPWFVPRPCFGIVHHLFGATAFQQVPAPVAAVTWLSERLIPRAYRDVPMLAISPSTKDDLVERGLSPDRVWVVPPGVDTEAYSPAAANPGSPLVVWIGRLEPYKRAQDLLEALPRVRESIPLAQAVFVGEGSARGDLERRAQELGLGDVVTFTGFVSEADKVDWLRKATVTVNTSEKEGWGMTVIEGNACGAPSVSANVHGLRDAVRDGETGLLFPCGDDKALARCLVRVFSEPGFREELVEKGSVWAQRFSWDRVADDTMSLIEYALGENQGPVSLRASPFEDSPRGD